MTRRYASDLTDRILVDLREVGGGTVADIAQSIGVDRGDIYPVLRRLRSESVVEIGGHVTAREGGKPPTFWRLK